MANSKDSENIFIGPDELKDYGIHYVPSWRLHLIKIGRFPAPIYLSRRRPVWRQSTILQWLKEREANPPPPSTAKPPPRKAGPMKRRPKL